MKDTVDMDEIITLIEEEFAEFADKMIQEMK